MDKNRFQSSILDWFAKNQRDLPWRRTQDPYKIWLSEIMLQQTQVATVIPYYERWIKEFPTPQAVVQAPEEKILKLWEGLGYYSRARNFQSACREVVEKYDGKIPDSLEEIQELPGIGRYTAGAILSIAYAKPVSLVDGNVARVLSRLFVVKKDPKKETETFWELAKSLVPRKQAGDFNQALMELGATICVPANPSCLICPVQNFCQAKKAGIQNQLPISPKRTKTQIVHLASALIRQNGKILLCQRKETGHLKGMWEPPTIPVPQNRNPIQELISFFKTVGLEVKLLENPIQLNTTRTHYRLRFEIFSAESPVGAGLPRPYNLQLTTHDSSFDFVQDKRLTTILGYPTRLSSSKWISTKQLSTLPMPGVWAKFFRASIESTVL